MREANPRSALEARTALCLHIEAQRPGASESERHPKRHRNALWFRLILWARA